MIPRKGYWITKSRNPKIPLFTPKAARRSCSNRRILEKYTYSPFVKVKKNDVVVDVGAFIGEFVLQIANKASRIIAIEPDPYNYCLLCRNTEHLKNVITIQNPLWNDNVKVIFKMGLISSDSSILDVDSKKIIKSIYIQAKRLDTLLSDLDIKKVDFLKIDAEGAEPEVLEGVEGYLKNIKKVAVDCSAERYGKTTLNSVQNVLKSAGFNVIKRGYMVYGWKD